MIEIEAWFRYNNPGDAMTTTAEALSAQAAQLPPAERMEVVERILDSLDQPDAALDMLWANEASDRLAAYRRGEIKAVALSDVIAKYKRLPRAHEHPLAGASTNGAGRRYRLVRRTSAGAGRCLLDRSPQNIAAC